MRVRVRERENVCERQTACARKRERESVCVRKRLVVSVFLFCVMSTCSGPCERGRGEGRMKEGRMRMKFGPATTDCVIVFSEHTGFVLVVCRPISKDTKSK